MTFPRLKSKQKLCNDCYAECVAQAPLLPVCNIGRWLTTQTSSYATQKISLMPHVRPHVHAAKCVLQGCERSVMHRRKIINIQLVHIYCVSISQSLTWYKLFCHLHKWSVSEKEDATEGINDELFLAINLFSVYISKRHIIIKCIRKMSVNMKRMYCKQQIILINHLLFELVNFLHFLQS